MRRIALAALFLVGCIPVEILSRKTVIESEPAPICKIEKIPEYKVPPPGPLDAGKP